MNAGRHRHVRELQREQSDALERQRYNNLDYQALIGNLVNGAERRPRSGAGEEAVRISAGRLGVIENNTIQNANNIGAVLKLHNGNT